MTEAQCGTHSQTLTMVLTLPLTMVRVSSINETDIGEINLAAINGFVNVNETLNERAAYPHALLQRVHLSMRRHPQRAHPTLRCKVHTTAGGLSPIAPGFAPHLPERRGVLATARAPLKGQHATITTR